MKAPAPTILGLDKSFGFGDRLGLAGPGHVATAKAYDFAPIFAQQSIREMDRTHRTPEEVMEAATKAIQQEGWDQPWGADADHLKTQEDVQKTAAAGFTFFTIDPSSFVNNKADRMSESELVDEVQKQEQDGIYGGDKIGDIYLDKEHEIFEGCDLKFDREALLRAAVKYGRATAHCEEMYGYIADANKNKPFEIEVSVDETDSATSPLEHLFFALELRRRGVTVISLAPRFIGEFEKGIDYKGDLKEFEDSLRMHVAIAKAYGPYKISVHSGSDKFSIYPIIGRVCDNLLHVKTAGTSYLEALRVVARTDRDLFAEIVRYSLGRFDEDKATYHISVTDPFMQKVRTSLPENLEGVFLDENEGRQVMHVTFGSVLTKGSTEKGRAFREAILENLRENDDLHKEVLEHHLGKHLKLLNAG